MDGVVFQGFWLEAMFVGTLILLNGFFAGAEIALISARRSRIQQLAAEGDARAQRVAALQEDPDRFLATVQIGVTFVGTLASAVGGAAAVRVLSPLIREIPLPGLARGGRADRPRRRGRAPHLCHADRGGAGPQIPGPSPCGAPGPVGRGPDRSPGARLTSLLVRFLTASNRFVLRLLGQKGAEERAFVSEEEVKHMLQEGRAQGVFDQTEQELIHSVFEFTEASVKEVMIPRPRIQAIDVETPVEQVLAYIIETGKSRYPVYRNTPGRGAGDPLRQGPLPPPGGEEAHRR